MFTHFWGSRKTIMLMPVQNTFKKMI
ncbi:unnamed protein product [Acanthoscelides obtectus]|uniref:Uncharacterized protein n=1 Tax=Acanthoscelides obtectus TaxID=200917 RepID=A0A9P0JUG7_ACAOB|nr:unnamed protein product [Acanthoscelides obtectus]CAK1642258.1 hypothetical protein AOBTE_LOCUS12928 [Acanthoscelides obtectus]